MLGKPKILEVEGPYQDNLTGYYYNEVHFGSEKEAQKWHDKQNQKLYPRRRFFEWLLDKLAGE